MSWGGLDRLVSISGIHGQSSISQELKGIIQFNSCQNFQTMAHELAVDSAGTSSDVGRLLHTNVNIYMLPTTGRGFALASMLINCHTFRNLACLLIN